MDNEDHDSRIEDDFQLNFQQIPRIMSLSIVPLKMNPLWPWSADGKGSFDDGA